MLINNGKAWKEKFMLKIQKIFYLFLFISLVGSTNALNASPKMDFQIRGIIIDSQSKNPVSYANVLLFTEEEKKQVNGIATDDEGYFELRDNDPGKYYLEIHFIGYQTKTISDITLDSENNSINLGEIPIQPDLISTDIIEVEAERSPITYQIDKKVINVDAQITASSGTAVDILENVPSVTVDIEGNVSLRGSSNFTVLIDGRPTILEAGDILQQISASSIENIEIITNPSAKFNPEGTAGIINLVMKKNNKFGFHGLIEGNGGYRERYGGQALVDYKTDKYQIVFDAGYSESTRYGDETERNITSQNGISSFRNSSGSSNRGGDRMRIRSEMNLQLSNKDFISFGASFQDRERRSKSDITFSEWTDLQPDPVTNISNTQRSRGGADFEVFMNYDHNFNNTGHLLRAEFDFEAGDGDEETVTELLNENRNITSGIKNTEAGPDREFRAKFDYTLPFDKETKFEAGYQNELDYSKEQTGYYDFNISTNQFDLVDQFSNDVSYRRSEHAVYSIYSSVFGSLGYQFGFRAEYTFRKIQLIETNESFDLNRWDYFPSVHTSYKFGKGQQVMASYTRRIDRPRSWYLEPFETWFDAYNVRIGNPSLKPEYIDSYEAGYQTIIGKTIFSTEVYHRVNHNKIERLRSVYAENITLNSIENVGTDYSSGAEIMFNFDPVKPWNINLLGNLFNYRIDGEIFDEPFSRESFNWNVRFNNRLKLWEDGQLQFNLSYNSESVSSQSEREGFFYSNMAFRQDFLDKTLSATLQVRDLFGTANYEFVSRGSDFYTYRKYNRDAPEVTLNLRLYINRRGRLDDGV